jgi:hypothetical protein
MKNKNILKLFLKLLLFILFCNNCSTNVPEIKDSYIQVNLFKDRENNLVYQKLSVFIIPFDGDGFEDLSVIYILNDGMELFWAVTSGQWVYGKNREDEWIGTNSIVMPELSDFPMGEYRIILEDLSGESIERSVYLNYKETNKDNYIFPYSYTDEENIYVQSIINGSEIWIYENDSFIDSINMDINGINKKNIFPEGMEFNRKYYIYIFDSELNMGIISGPFFKN